MASNYCPKPSTLYANTSQLLVFCIFVCILCRWKQKVNTRANIQLSRRLSGLQTVSLKDNYEQISGLVINVCPTLFCPTLFMATLFMIVPQWHIIICQRMIHSVATARIFVSGFASPDEAAIVNITLAETWMLESSRQWFQSLP